MSGAAVQSYAVDHAFDQGRGGPGLDLALGGGNGAVPAVHETRCGGGVEFIQEVEEAERCTKAVAGALYRQRGAGVEVTHVKEGVERYTEAVVGAARRQGDEDTVISPDTVAGEIERDREDAAEAP